MRFLPCFVAIASSVNPGDALDNSLTPHGEQHQRNHKNGKHRSVADRHEQHRKHEKHLKHLKHLKHTEHEEPKSKEEPEVEPPRLVPHPNHDGGVPGGCSNHWLGGKACWRCGTPLVRDAAAARQANYSAWKSATFLYPHAQKTGGSTLECATEHNALFPRWINLGHTNRNVVEHCREACTFGEQAPKLVVMIRDPYDFWASRFLFAWDCKYAKTCTSAFNIKDFLGFLKFVKMRLHWGNGTLGSGHSPWEPQSQLHEQHCGKPCKHDFLFHTETMQDDWFALMDKIGANRTLLPQTVNPSPHGPQAPAIHFTSEALDIIHLIDANMFEEWGYKKRKEPFAADMTRLMAHG